MTDDDIEPLLDRLRAGEPTALAALFDHFRPRLLRMVEFRLDPRLRGRLDPEDVLQDAFVDAQKRIRAWLDDQQSFYVWLRLITQQTMVDLFRHHIGAKMRNAAHEVLAPQSGPISGFFVGTMTSPSQAAERDELRAKVVQALDEMDPTDREVLVLRHFEELGNKETALLLGIQENAASNRYVRALGRLRKILERGGAG